MKSRDIIPQTGSYLYESIQVINLSQARSDHYDRFRQLLSMGAMVDER